MARESKYEGSEHESASEIAKSLCDHLHNCLPEDYLPQRHFTDSTCGAYVKGRKASLYWLYHYDDHVSVYPYSKQILGTSKEIQRLLPFGVILQTRQSLESDWAKVAPYFFDIQTDEQANGMAPLLRYLSGLNPSSLSPAKSGARGYWYPPSEEAEPTTAAAEEGNRIAFLINRYERNRKNRNICIKAHGALCSVCGFDFSVAYGKIGKGYIHVHHLKPLGSLGGKPMKIDPIEDLRPVCPNCHEMLHQCNPPYSIAQLQAIIAAANAGR